MKPLLTLGDTDIYPEDAQLIPGSWFNDKLMSLEIERLRLAGDVPAQLLVVDPLNFLLLAFSDVAEHLATLNAASFAYVAVTINDLEENTLNNGQHWALLLFDRRASVCYVFDSIPGRTNPHVARLVAGFSGFYATRLCPRPHAQGSACGGGRARRRPTGSTAGRARC